MNTRKVRAAIAFYRASHYLTNGQNDGLVAVIEAAEAYLATLPEPHWTVCIWMDETEAFETRGWVKEADARVGAVAAMAAGARKVEIKAP